MSLTLSVVFTLFSSLASTAVVLPALIPLDNSLRPPQPISISSLPNKITNTSSPPSNALRVRCASTYGHNVNPSSCRNALTQFGPRDEEATFAQRNTGHPDTIPLPLRFVSDDGLCFVQPLLKAESETGRASSKQIGDTAYTMFQECVVGKALGGYAEGIGGDNNIQVVIGDYAPHVRCDKPPAKGPPWHSCLMILSDMPATVDRKVFGVRSQDARVQVNVPYYLKSIDARCQMEVGITGKSTSASWYEIWEAAAALIAMCVRASGKGGKAFGIGLRKNIFLRVLDENPDFSGSAADGVNGSASAALLGLEASEE